MFLYVHACMSFLSHFIFFFFNATATTEIYTLSLHDALPIFHMGTTLVEGAGAPFSILDRGGARSEEHTSELQSRGHLVCRLLLEKKKKRRVHDADSSSLQSPAYKIDRDPLIAVYHTNDPDTL